MCTLSVSWKQRYYIKSENYDIDRRFDLIRHMLSWTAHALDSNTVFILNKTKLKEEKGNDLYPTISKYSPMADELTIDIHYNKLLGELETCRAKLSTNYYK